MADNPDKLLDAFVARLEDGPLTTHELKELLKEFGRLKVDQYKAWLMQQYKEEFAGSLGFPDRWEQYYPQD